MDEARQTRLEMPVTDLTVSTWLNVMSEAKKRGLKEIPIAGKRYKKALEIGPWLASTDTPVDLKVIEEEAIPSFLRSVKDLDYDNTKDLPGEDNVSPSTRTRSRRKKRRPGPIFLDGRDFHESGSEGELGSDESDNDDDRYTMLSPGGGYDEEDRIIMLAALRENLKYDERVFKKQYIYGAYGSSDESGTPYVKMDVRHCITLFTSNAFAFPELSYGISWVGVHSGNDICVATFRDRLDRERVQACLVNFSTPEILSIFRRCVLSEIEDLTDPSSKLCEKLHRSIDDFPFCVVSATTPVYHETPDESAHKTSSDAYDVPDAVVFVQESGLLEQAKDRGGAIQLAISTFQRLMSCEAEEIEVTVVSGQRNGRVTIKDGRVTTSELGFPEISEYA